MQLTEVNINSLLGLVFWIIGIALAVKLFWFVADKVWKILFQEAKMRELWRHYSYLAEGMSWCLFVGLIIFRTVSSLSFIGVIIVLVVIAASWNFVTNYVCGLVVLSQANYVLGSRLTVGTVCGEIKSCLRTTMLLEAEDGTQTYVPYVQLLRKSVSKSVLLDSIEAATFEVRLNSHKAGAASIRDQVMRHVTSLPWSLVHRIPVVEIKESNDKGIVLLVKSFSLSKHTANLIKESVYCFVDSNFCQ